MKKGGRLYHRCGGSLSLPAVPVDLLFITKKSEPRRVRMLCVSCGKQDLNSSGYPPKPLKYGAFSVSVSPFSKVVSPICRVAMTGLSLNISKIVSNIVSLIYFRAESSFVI